MLTCILDRNSQFQEVFEQNGENSDMCYNKIFTQV